jgi:hypothetical protein
MSANVGSGLSYALAAVCVCVCVCLVVLAHDEFGHRSGTGIANDTTDKCRQQPSKSSCIAAV